ncbi:oxalate:formate antiporter [Aureimonas sp. AU12]|nr:oxalate:formate antiporter [Aureimonas sp. AU12]
MAPETNTTSPLKIALAWGFVGIPLLWGVVMTLRNALQLFQ